MKTKLIVSLFLFMCFACVVHAQDTGKETKTFAQIKAEKEAAVLLSIEQAGSTVEQEMAEEGSEYNEFLKWVSFWEPRLGPNGTFDDYFKMLRSSYEAGLMSSSRTKSYGNADAWKELGPYDMPTGGQHSLTSLNPLNYSCQPGIGPTHFLTFYRPNTDKMLCCSRVGGLFYSADKGLNWTNAGSDGWAHSGCRSACFSPDSPQTWYACAMIGGTSELDMIRMAMGYSGVYRTTNNGVSYSLIADYTTFPDHEQTILNKIIVDPNNPAIGYVSTSCGLYKSTNINDVTPSNVTWSLIKSGTVSDIEFKPGNSNVIYAVVQNGTNWTIEYTTNQGASWQSPIYSVSNVANVTIEVTEANSDLLYYLSVNNSYSASLFCYTYSLGTSVYKSGAFDHHKGQGNGFTVSNFNANYVYVNVSDTQFQQSTDGGSTWTSISSAATDTHYHHDVEYITTPPATCSSCSSDVWICTHGGLSYSDDNCSHVYPRMNGLGVAEVIGISTSQTNPEKISIGMYHDATAMSDGSYGSNWLPSWEPTFVGDGQPPLLDYSDPDYAWASDNTAAYSLSSTAGHAYSYTEAVNFPAKSGAFFNFISQNPIYPNYVYAFGVTSNYYDMYRSGDRGKTTTTFDKISDFQNVNGIGADEKPTFWIHCPTNPDYIYVRLDGGAQNLIMRNKHILDAPSTVINNWEQLPMPTGVPANTFVYSMVTDVNNPNILYLLYNGYWWPLTGHNIWKADYTNILSPVFTDITGNFPYTGVGKIVAEKGSNGGLYISTDLGEVYYANNSTINGSSTTWSALGYGLPRLTSSDMEINYASNRIRIAMKGRGVWEHDLECPGNLSLTYSGTQSGTQYDEAVNSITSSAVLASANTFTYRAGSYVLLSPGFSATPNSSNSFLAFIHPCSYVGNSPVLRDEEPEHATDNSGITTNADNGLLVYPNPSTDVFTIATEQQHGVIQVFDVMGNKLTSIELKEKTKEYLLDLSKYPKGIYFLNMISDGQRISKKIVLE